MELIKKKISLSNAINRYGEGASLGKDFQVSDFHGVDMPTYRIYTCNECGRKTYDKFEKCTRILEEVMEDGVTIYYHPCDSEDISESEPYVRFGTASNYVSWLRKFFTESHLYKYCMKHSTYYWRDEGPAGSINGCSITFSADTDSVRVVSVLPSEAQTGSYVILSDDAEIFNSTFVTVSNAIEFYEDFCEKLAENGGRLGYFDIHVLLTEKYEDLGRFLEYGDRKECITHDVSAFTESKLQSLRRSTVSYDIDGNELPFFLNENNEAELPYIVDNPRNVRIGDNGVCYYDVVRDISFDEDEGTVSITYEVGASVDEDDHEMGGILHTEKYYYEVVNERFNISGFSAQYEYIDIDYDTIVETGNSFVSEVTVNGQEAVSVPTNFVFDEALAGVHDYSESVSKVNIERGSSASFEPLNLMGQFSSVEEIERYSGDLFKIGVENN